MTDKPVQGKFRGQLLLYNSFKQTMMTEMAGDIQEVAAMVGE